MNTFKILAILFLAIISSFKSQTTMPYWQFQTFMEVSTVRYYYYQKETTYEFF